MTSLRSAVGEATATLTAAGVPTPRPDALLLAAHALGCDRAEVERRTLLGADLDEMTSRRLDALVEERVEPRVDAGLERLVLVGPRGVDGGLARRLLEEAEHALGVRRGAVRGPHAHDGLPHQARGVLALLHDHTHHA